MERTTLAEPAGPSMAKLEPTSETAEGRPTRALAALTLTSTAGLLLVALAYWAARSGYGWASALFWVGLMVLVLPMALRLCGRTASDGERLTAVILLGMALYAIPLLLSPNGFALHDELGQMRSVTAVLRTGRLYAPNPLVPAYGYYPGILSVTAALSRMSGLHVFASGVVVVAVARLVLMAGLFMLIKYVFRSGRIAGLAVLVYAANPNFVFFDSEFAYESLALGLAAITLWAVARVANDEGTWRDVAIAAVLDAALVLTHHLTSYAVGLVIVFWMEFVVLTRTSHGARRRLTLLAVFTAAITAAYALAFWGPTSSDIGSSIVGSLHGLLTVIQGQAASKAPFTSAHGYSVPFLEQAVGIASVVLLICALPFGLLALWRRRPMEAGIAVLSLVALLYPFAILLRLTAAGSETSNRTSEFLFIGLGAALATAFVALLYRRVDRPGRRGLSIKLLATAYFGLVFAGGITVGTPTYDLLPAHHFSVSAGPHSVDAESVDAATWAERTLPGGVHFLADANDTALLTAYSRLYPQTGDVHGKGIGELFVAPTIGPFERLIITYDRIRYLVVDRRDASALPASGSYFESATPVLSFRSPIALAALNKFAASPCIDRIFSSTDITVYDTEPMLEGCR